MGRKPGFNTKKIEAILIVLAGNPEGLWLRRLAREASLSTTTVSKYVTGPLKPLIEVVNLGEEKPFLRVVRLKTAVFQRIQEGQSIGDILRVYSLIQRAKNN